MVSLGNPRTMEEIKVGTSSIYLCFLLSNSRKWSLRRTQTVTGSSQRMNSPKCWTKIIEKEEMGMYRHPHQHNPLFDIWTDFLFIWFSSLSHWINKTIEYTLRDCWEDWISMYIGHPSVNITNNTQMESLSTFYTQFVLLLCQEQRCISLIPADSPVCLCCVACCSENWTVIQNIQIHASSFYQWQ